MEAVRVDRATGVHHRKSDRLILAEVPDVYGNVPVEPGDVVLDLGAHIGLTSRLLLEKGAARTVAVEADPANLPILRQNLAGLTATIIGAAVGATRGKTAFYVRPDRHFVGSVLGGDPTRERLTVPVVAFGDLLRDHEPTIVKCDIEFGEYDLPELRALPDHVRVVAIEVHIRYVGVFWAREMGADELRQRREAAADLMASFTAQGFREHWRQDKQVTPKQALRGEAPAAHDASGLGPMTKCVCVTYIR